MPEQSDVRHSLSAKVIVRAVPVIALLTALVWWVPYGSSLIHLLGAGLQRRLTIPVFSIGTQAVTPISLLKALLFLGLLTLLSNRVRKLLYFHVSRTSTFDPQHSYVLARFVSLLIYVIGLMIGLQAAGVNLNSLTIRVGARSTWVRTYDNEVIIVPNSDFTTHQVTNWTVNDDRVRLAIGVVVAPDSDAEKIAALLLEVARENPSVLTDPPPEALLNDLAKDSLIFSLRFWTIIEAHDNHRLKSDLRLLILKKLHEHGISVGETSSSVGKAASA